MFKNMLKSQTDEIVNIPSCKQQTMGYHRYCIGLSD